MALYTTHKGNIMITYAEYTTGKVPGRQRHCAYYGQFVTESVKRQVVARFTLKRLTDAAKRGWAFNSIPLVEWDRFIGWDGKTVHAFGLAEEIRATGGAISCSTINCIVKEAARQAVLAADPTISIGENA